MNQVEQTVLDRMGTIEKNVASIAESNQVVSTVLTQLLREQEEARNCRASMREGLLDLKTMVVEMRDEASKERAAMSTQMTVRVKPGTIGKVVGAAMLALLTFLASQGPHVAAVTDQVTKVIK